MEGRKEFHAWYDSKIDSKAEFDFQREILEYCRSDVDILRRACLKFKNLLWEATNGDDGDGVDAFGSCTIASLCMDVFKTKFLPEEWKVLVEVNGDEQWLPERRLDGKSTVYYQGQWIPKRDLGLVIKQELFVSSPIARPPPNGYHSRLNYSKKSIAWLEWICHSARNEGKHLEIRHALTARGEYHVPGTRYFVDGYTPPCPENPSGVVCVSRMSVPRMPHLLQKWQRIHQSKYKPDGIRIVHSDTNEGTPTSRIGSQSSGYLGARI